MDTKLTLEQFVELTKNMVVNDDGSTNKKCPICGFDVMVYTEGNSEIIKCVSENCFAVHVRGV